MGKKSDKKIKSDRVNALRKQYDAFLEEDKKRKERNEYILGRLDNMRYSATAVLVRHKPIVYGDIPIAGHPIYNRTTSRPEQVEHRDILAHSPQKQNHPNHENLQLDIKRNYLDSTSLLKEISKNYILIPKLRSSLSNDYVGTIPPQSLPPIAFSAPQPNVARNEDWKSKYDILEKLKKEETEEEPTKYGNEEIFPVKENQNLNKDDSQKSNESYNLQNYNPKEFTTKYEHEVPEKDLSFDKITVESEPQNVEKSKISDSKDQEPSMDYAPKSSASIHNSINPDVDPVVDYSLQNQGLEYQTPIEETVLNTSNIEENVHYDNQEEITLNNTEQTIVYNENEYPQNENEIQDEYSVQYEQPVEIEEKYPDTENVYAIKEDDGQTQDHNPAQIVDEKHTAEVNNESKEDIVYDYPVDMISVQEFTPKEDVQLIDGVNINPNYLASEQTIDPMYEENIEPETTVQQTEEPQESSGIEAFDAEQREMFYSETTPEYGYDQQGGEVYNQEYAQDNEQAQENAYYESPAVLLEQEYPVEINEHEESTTRYDQSYEQQYATDYANQEYQEQQQYDQTEGYDQSQEQYQDYQYQEADQETVQSVEQVLDTEQGFVNEQNLAANEENATTAQ